MENGTEERDGDSTTGELTGKDEPREERGENRCSACCTALASTIAALSAVVAAATPALARASATLADSVGLDTTVDRKGSWNLSGENETGSDSDRRGPSDEPRELSGGA